MIGVVNAGGNVEMQDWEPKMKGFVISTISHHDTFGKIHLFGPIIIIAVVTGIIHFVPF